MNLPEKTLSIINSASCQISKNKNFDNNGEHIELISVQDALSCQLSIIITKSGFFKFAIHPFHTTGLFLYPLKASENQKFSDINRGNKKRPVA